MDIHFTTTIVSDINEIIFGVFLGVFLGIFMLIVKKRYYGIEKPYKKPICSLMGNKYKCKKTEEKEFGCDDYEKNYEINYDCASGDDEKTKSNVLSCIVGITSLIIIFLTFFLVQKSVEKEPNAIYNSILLVSSFSAFLMIVAIIFQVIF